MFLFSMTVNACEEYKYNNQKEQAEKRIMNGLNVTEYYRFAYDNGLKTKTQYFVADTVVRVDTFIYDTNHSAYW